MAEIYVITDTRGVDQFIINPGDTNSDTDLKLPGKGAIVWGENLDENAYRLMENFAVEEKGGSPGNPQDAIDLGTGNGVNNPLEGQNWWNITQKKLYVFDGTNWQKIGTSTGSVPPSPASEGDLWFDDVAQQLKVFDGGSFVSTALQYLRLDGASQMSGALDMGTNFITDVIDPVNPQDGATKKYVDDLETSLSGGFLDSRYIEVAGDTMVGDLVLNADPTLALGAATKQYVDAVESSLTVVINDVVAFEPADIKASALQTIAGLGTDWLLCDGSAVSRATFAALFAALNAEGLVYGNGDGATTFNVPDFQGRSPVGSGTGSGLSPRALGATGGEEDHQLITAEMPSHTHTAPSLPHSNVNIPTGNNPRQLGFPGAGPPTGSTGGDGDHNTMHPFLAINYFIKT